MNISPGLAPIAVLLGDPTRSIMLTALMDGRALTVSELAQVAGVAVPTASEHLTKLAQAGVLAVEKQGRHRYYRLDGTEVADVIEGLMGIAQRAYVKRVATGPRDSALRRARVCYDHLAGEFGVALLDGLRTSGSMVGDADLVLTDKGVALLLEFGIDLDTLRRGRRPLCRTCVDWSERRHHLGGALGAALLDRFLEQRWLSHGEGRALSVTPRGTQRIAELFGVTADRLSK
jgi:DNA-binding transcriptional ArsR family regulator